MSFEAFIAHIDALIEKFKKYVVAYNAVAECLSRIRTVVVSGETAWSAVVDAFGPGSSAVPAR